MQLEVHICQLLFRYNCVVVPGFGAFLSHEKAASHHEKTNTFYPPTKQLSFNEQLLVGDGILVSQIAATIFKTYEEALALVQYEVKKWNHVLSKGESLELEGLGVLDRSNEGKIDFSPQQQVNYLAASFGLSPIIANPIVTPNNKKVVSEPLVFSLDAQELKNKRSYGFILKYAAAGLIGISVFLSTYSSYNTHLKNRLVAQEEAQKLVDKKIQEAAFFLNNPWPLATLEISLPKKETAKLSFFVIAGAFRAPENASKKIAQLKRDGFKDASYLGPNRWGLHQVSYGAFTEEQEARNFLANIQTQFAKDAWLLIQKK